MRGSGVRGHCSSVFTSSSCGSFSASSSCGSFSASSSARALGTHRPESMQRFMCCLASCRTHTCDQSSLSTTSSSRHTHTLSLSLSISLSDTHTHTDRGVHLADGLLQHLNVFVVEALLHLLWDEARVLLTPHQCFLARAFSGRK